MSIIAGTGHRPPRLGLDYGSASRARLVEFARKELRLLAAEGPVGRVITGGAQGWDQALAHACLCESIPYDVYVPFEDFHSKWPAEALRLFEMLANNAGRVLVVNPGPYAKWKYAARDEKMVDDATMVLALLDSRPEHSGTGLTVLYAGRKGVPVRNAWPRWSAPDPPV